MKLPLVGLLIKPELFAEGIMLNDSVDTAAEDDMLYDVGMVVTSEEKDELEVKEPIRDTVLLTTIAAEGYEDAVTVWYEVTEDPVQEIPLTPLLVLFQPGRHEGVAMLEYVPLEAVVNGVFVDSEILEAEADVATAESVAEETVFDVPLAVLVDGILVLVDAMLCEEIVLLLELDAAPPLPEALLLEVALESVAPLLGPVAVLLLEKGSGLLDGTWLLLDVTSVLLDASLPAIVVLLLEKASVVAAVEAEAVKPRLNVSVGIEDVDDDDESGVGASGMILILL